MANRIKGITVEIGGDTTGLDKALKGVNSTIRATQINLKDVNRLLKLDPSNTELLSQKQKELKNATSATKDKLETLKTAQIQAKQQLENGKLGQDKYDALQREILETENELKKLQSQASKTNAAMEKIGNVGSKMQEVGGKISSVGKKFMPVSLAVAGVGAAAVKTTAEFDTSMSKVSAISGSTGKDLDKLKKKAREMGAKTKFSASQAADAMTYMAMAGWKTNDMLDGIDGVMNLAAASGEDLATTSDIVTDALTAFGLSSKDSGHFADILAAASSNANTNVSMMGETFKYAAPIAGSLGFSAEDTAQAIGLMANAGIKSSQAGTSLRGIMTKLTKDFELNSVASGKVKIATKNADGSMRSLSEILADCRGAFGKMTESEKANAAQSLVGKNAMSGFLALMNAAPSDVEKLSLAINNCDGTSEKMANTMQDNLAGQLTILKSQLQELAISFGEMLMPAIRSIVSHVQSFVDKLNLMSESQRQVILKIALFVAAIGPVLVTVGSLISKIGGAVSGFAALGKGVSTFVFNFQNGIGIAGKLGTALAGVSAPVLAIVGVIATLVLAFKHLWSTSDSFRESILSTIQRIKDTFTQFTQGIVDRVNALGFDFKNFTDMLSSLWNGFCQLLAPVFEGIFNYIANKFQMVTGIITGALDVFIGLFTGDWGQLWDGVKGIFFSIWNGIKGFFSNILNVIKGIADTVLKWFGSSWEEAWNGVKNFLMGLWNGIKDFFSSIWNGIKGVFSSVGGFFKEKFTQAKDGIKNAFSTVGGFFSNVWSKTKETFSNTKEFFSNKFSQARDGMKNAFSNIKSVFSGIWEKIKAPFAKVGSFFKDIFGGAVEGIKNCFNGIKNVIKTPVNWIIDGINKLIGGINKISFDIPDWVPVIGGGTFGFNIPAIPRLAKGTVVPKNNGEFPAILGDNRREPEVVSSLSTMQKALHNALSDFMKADKSSLVNGLERSMLSSMESFCNKIASAVKLSNDTSAIEKYLSVIANNSKKDIYLDDETLVGKILPKIDKGLGKTQSLQRRLSY